MKNEVDTKKDRFPKIEQNGPFSKFSNDDTLIPSDSAESKKQTGGRNDVIGENVTIQNHINRCNGTVSFVHELILHAQGG